VSLLNTLISQTAAAALFIVGLATCIFPLFAIDVNLLPVVLRFRRWARVRDG
jgi:hypothetical protein